MAEKNKTLIVIDSNSVIHRAYHALPPLTTKKGELVNAVYGFLLVFFKIIREFDPDCLIACFDSPALTFRHKKFKAYKAKRPPTPPELASQFPKIKEILKAFNVSVFEKAGYEADDLIGTLSCLLKEKLPPQAEIIILSGDLDNLQLINEKTKVYVLRKGVKDTILYDENLVREKYQGLGPEQLVDFKALKGDPSDNVSGLKGIGEKTAQGLIREFGSLEQLYSELESKSEKSKKIKPKIKEILLSQKEIVFFNRTLVKICKNAPLDFDFAKCRWEGYDQEKITAILQNFEFYTLIKRLPELNKHVKETGENLTLW